MTHAERLREIAGKVAIRWPNLSADIFTIAASLERSEGRVVAEGTVIKIQPDVHNPSGKWVTVESGDPCHIYYTNVEVAIGQRVTVRVVTVPE